MTNIWVNNRPTYDDNVGARVPTASRHLNRETPDFTDTTTPAVNRRPGCVLSLDELVCLAFHRLPAPTQRILWWACIDPRPVAFRCEVMEVDPGRARALELRAREALRYGWLICAIEYSPKGCRPTIGLLSPYSVGVLDEPKSSYVEDHLSACEWCCVLADDFMHLTARLQRAMASRTGCGGTARSTAYAAS